MKKTMTLITFFILLIWTTACQNFSNPATNSDIDSTKVSSVTVINPLGPLVIPASGITSGEVKGDIEIDVQNWKTIDEVTAFLSNGSASFAVLPVTTAANLSANGIDLVLLGVYEWKVFYLLASQDTEFVDWNSLIGKTIYTPEAKGQTVDTLTRYALVKSGIKPDEDVTFTYAPAQEIVALFKEGKVDFAALPEPYVSLALSEDSGSIVLDYQEYWSQESGSVDGIPVAGLFVKRDFYENNPAVTQSVETAWIDSIEWANENPEDALQASSSILTLPAEVMKSALQRMDFDYVTASDSKQEVMDFLVGMQTIYPEGIKAIPDETFFAD